MSTIWEVNNFCSTQTFFFITYFLDNPFFKIIKRNFSTGREFKVLGSSLTSAPCSESGIGDSWCAAAVGSRAVAGAAWRTATTRLASPTSLTVIYTATTLLVTRQVEICANLTYNMYRGSKKCFDKIISKVLFIQKHRKTVFYKADPRVFTLQWPVL